MQYKTPGVYIEEISIFPPSVASVETAIPAFIGHTEKALDADGQSLSNIPTKINSLVEFEQHFGAAHQPAAYEVTLSSFSVSAIAVEKYYLYQSMQLYFSNGGGPCYIVSVGSYSDDLDPVNFNTGLNALVKYDEPTLILFPDAVGVNEDGTQLGVAELGALQANTLAQCAKLQDRFGVFDLRNGDSDANTVVQNFRENIGINNLRYGAAYYPFLDTSLPADIPLRLILESSNPITDLDVSPLNPSTAQSTLVSDMQTAISNTNTVGLSGFNYLDLLDI
ncbi:MAG: phage tail protein, partial [Bacteroidota bacterium]